VKRLQFGGRFDGSGEENAMELARHRSLIASPKRASVDFLRLREKGVHEFRENIFGG
jgi:hypothetical protein